MSEPTTPRIRRRALLGAATATLGASAGAAALASRAGAVAPTAAEPLRSPQLLTRFARPTSVTAAGFRWWWPHGLVDPAQIAREVDTVADAGFGVLEIADVTHSLRARDIDVDVARYGWGTRRWVDGVKAALTRARRRDVRIDITVGPSWPAAVRTITPDDDAACTELAHGRVDVAGGTTFEGPVPDPVVAPEEGVSRRTLVAVQAFRVTAQTAALTTLDRASHVDLTERVVDGRVTFTAPDGGAWVLLSYWRRGSAQEPEAAPHTSPRSYVVDHFSALGSDAVIDLWERTILDRQLRRLLQDAGGYLFEDSLEIETHATIWTPQLLAEFRTRMGYDLTPLLPAVVEVNEKYVFAFDAPTTTRVRDDYNQLLSDLYRDHHLLPLQQFARSLGMGLRVQPYGLETDTVEHAALLDVPETESLGFKNLDDYRVMAGGRDLAGHTVLSCEAICYNGAAYNTTWERALQTVNSIFAAGVNQCVIHGFAYADAPEVTWPGFAAFSPYYNGAIGFGEAWGPRMPQWQHMPDIAAYLNRTQLVLQSGTPRYDIVFLRQKGWASTGIGAPWATNNGIPIGWSHSFATPALLDLPRVRVENGRLAPDGPAYRVMVIGPDQFRGGERTLALDAARRVLELARAGLRVVMFGDWSAAEPVGLAQPGETEELRAVVAALIALPTTRVVANDAALPGAFADLGIERDVVHDASTVMHLRRVVDDTDLYYLANAKHAENRRLARVTQDVDLTATHPDAEPWVLDAWTGAATPVARWERVGGRVRVEVDLLPGQSTVIALRPPEGPRLVHAVAASAPVRRLPQVPRGLPALGWLGARSGLVIRAGSAGVHTATLSNGREVRVQVRRVREPLVPTSWELAVEDWQPAPWNAPTGTVRPVRRHTLTTLAPWSQIPGLEDVSGIGRYRTVVDLGRDWTDEDGAMLELGEVNDTVRVTVNGRPLPLCDPLVPTVDLGGLLRRGRNELEVEVASTLLNRLRTVTPAVYGVAARQAYGLVGPVRLVPYVEKRLTS